MSCDNLQKPTHVKQNCLEDTWKQKSNSLLLLKHGHWFLHNIHNYHVQTGWKRQNYQLKISLSWWQSSMVERKKQKKKKENKNQMK